MQKIKRIKNVLKAIEILFQNNQEDIALNRLWDLEIFLLEEDIFNNGIENKKKRLIKRFLTGEEKVIFLFEGVP